MGFRISDANVFNDALRNVRLNRFRLAQAQIQNSSGRRVNSAADDPSAAARIMGLRRLGTQLDQYGRNLDAAEAQLNNTDAAVDALTGVFTRLRELALQANSQGPLSAEAENIVPEVEQLFDEVLRLASMRVGDRYLFGGIVSDTAPYVKGGSFTDGVVSTNPTITQANADAGEGVIEVQIGGATRMQVNVEGGGLFLGDTDGDGTADGVRVNLFDVVRELRNRIVDNTTGNPADLTGQLDQAIDQIVQTRGDLGARMNRVEITRGQYAALDASLELERSWLEDIDPVEAAVELENAEIVFQRSLAVTARVIQPSLLDFLG